MGADSLRTGIASAPTWPLDLMNLPAEIQLEIFNHLDPVSAVVLSLTCKTLRAVHSRLQLLHRNNSLDSPCLSGIDDSRDKGCAARIPLEAWCILPPDRESGIHLYELLQDWVPEGMVYEYVRERVRGLLVSSVDVEGVRGRRWSNEMERRVMKQAVVMKRAMEKARAWREANGWFEGGVWRVLCEGGGNG